MDNVTHTLIGIAAGETVSAYRRKARIPLWIASGLANNLPDFDVMATSLVFRDKLGYLLHHRGHSHTFVAAPLLALLAGLPLYFLWRRKEMPWREIIFLLCLGPLLHLLADSWNSYGVHPWWPINNRWFYGDMVFIVEPWIWAALIPGIYFACESRLGKGLCIFLSLAVAALAWHHDYVPWPAAAALTFGVGFAYWIQSKLPTRPKRALVSLCLLASILATLGSFHLRLYAKYHVPGEELMLQPFPANPFCFMGMRARLDNESYTAKIFLLAPFPSIFPLNRCPEPLKEGTTAPLAKPMLSSSDPGLREIGTFAASRSEFQSLAASCVGNAFLRFSRIPYWRKTEHGWILGDLRFDRDPGLSFGEFSISENEPCPKAVPPWVGKFHPENL